MSPSFVCSSEKSGRPSSSRATTSPSTIAWRASIQRGGLSSFGKYVAASLRLRVQILTFPSSTTAWTRNPSHLISNSQSSSSNGVVARVASIGSIDFGIAAAAAPVRSIWAVAAGASLTHRASRSTLTSSFVRPVFTLCGWSSASQPSTACSSFLWMSSHCSPSSPSNARDGALPGRRLVRTIVKRPLSFSPSSTNLSSPSSTALRASSVGASGCHVPQSQTMTSPAPYCFAGITPSKSKYSIGWSSTWTAMRRIFGSRVGPFGTAQLTRTPSISSRTS